MRHRKCLPSKLNRTSSHRKAMFRNMSASLIVHGRIKTTLPKAKGLRIFIEPIITKAKKPTDHHKRLLSSRLGLRFNNSPISDHKSGDKKAFKMLFEVAEKMKDRPGGYTRILKTGEMRPGDGAEICIVEFVA